MTIRIIKNKIIPQLKRYGAVKIAIFGSFAIGKEKKSSDVDILVKFQNDVSLLELSGIKLKLENKLGRKVDILTYDGINHRLRDIILQEQKIIYEKRS